MIGLWRVPTISSRLGGVSLAWIGFVVADATKKSRGLLGCCGFFFARARAGPAGPTHDRPSNDKTRTLFTRDRTETALTKDR